MGVVGGVGVGVVGGGEGRGWWGGGEGGGGWGGGGHGAAESGYIVVRNKAGSLNVKRLL